MSSGQGVGLAGEHWLYGGVLLGLSGEQKMSVTMAVLAGLVEVLFRSFLSILSARLAHKHRKPTLP